MLGAAILIIFVGGFISGIWAYRQGYKNGYRDAQEKIDYMSIDLC